MMTSGYFKGQHEGRMRLAPVLGASLIGVGGSLLGNLFGGGNKTNQNQTSTQNSTTNASSTPTFDPRFQPLLNMLLGRSASQLSTGSALPRGFDTNAVESINSAFKGAGSNLQNSLTARGLANSPVAAPALGGLEQARAAEIGDLGVKLPMLERDAQNQQFAQLMGLLGMGRGQNTTSATQGTSTGNAQTQGPNTTFNDLGGLLGYLYGQGAFGGGTTGGAPGGGTVFHSDRRLKVNIELVGSIGPLGIYRWNWRDANQKPVGRKIVGFMADEVEGFAPDAVSVDGAGWKMVDYGKVGRRLEAAQPLDCES